MATLPESEARTLAGHIVRELRALGVDVESFGVHLEPDGFWFMARITGHDVWARTGQGNFTYAAVALELAAAALKAKSDQYAHTA